ncbi:hypothetical protein AB205_0168690, partial [Aquarana catesbeiana]
MSRVCIVVLEEGDDESPDYVSKLTCRNPYCPPPPAVVTPPLVQAIFNGDPDEVRALIFKKEDVNFQVKIIIERNRKPKLYIYFDKKPLYR